jgi:hypothetical protein
MEGRAPRAMLTGRPTRGYLVRLGKANPPRAEYSRAEQGYSRYNATSPHRTRNDATVGPKTRAAKSEPRYDAAMFG